MQYSSVIKLLFVFSPFLLVQSLKISDPEKKILENCTAVKP